MYKQTSIFFMLTFKNGDYEYHWIDTNRKICYITDLIAELFESLDKESIAALKCAEIQEILNIDASMHMKEYLMDIHDGKISFDADCMTDEDDIHFDDLRNIYLNDRHNFYRMVSLSKCYKPRC
jgi:hypothetical protein